MKRIKFTYHPPGWDRVHTINEEDVKIVLQRLPEELWQRLKEVHFNDGRGVRRYLGYVMTQGRHEISICAVPPRISLSTYLSRNESAEMFGALRGCQWPRLAVRRFMLYKVFLHEIGHLQIISEKAKSARRKFADETLAQAFAEQWRKRLWSKPFDYPDTVHNPPSKEEIATVQKYWHESHTEYKKGFRYDNENRDDIAVRHYEKSIETYPDHSLALERLGILTYFGAGNSSSLEKAAYLLQRAVQIDPTLAEANLHLALAWMDIGETEKAEPYFKRAIILYDTNTEVPLRHFANYLVESGRFKEAEVLYKKAIRKNKTFQPAYLDYGRLLLHDQYPDRDKRLARAVNLLKMAVGLDPEDAEAHYLLGRALKQFDQRQNKAT